MDKHLSLEKCTKALEKYLLDLAKIGYQARLGDGVGTVPTLKEDVVEGSNQIANEGWAITAQLRSTIVSARSRRNISMPSLKLDELPVER